ncbi:hypothetical protein [Halobacterium jilantaiense]|uniref:Uncharacterized protein n=1 Tax=Halobacterium jilantaiense TaxID=355548 RepID=A0A1I0P7F8_9EURY|nr:hypothetical protein [Halobacterium jilantaiense]SEW10278.1 hypothetical protein SAMN04487945_1462 [Halobacterium jilantaiense]
MSEQEPEAEGEEEQPEASETSENEDSEEQPDIEPDERADMGELADLADQVEAEAGADVDDEETEDDTESSDEDAPAAPAETGTTDWGDLYVGTVTTGLNAVIDEYGDEDADHIDESLARDLHLDEYVNDWMAQQGKAEMDPAQGMLIATAALCATVLVSRTDLPNKAVSKLQQDNA